MWGEPGSSFGWYFTNGKWDIELDFGKYKDRNPIVNISTDLSEPDVEYFTVRVFSFDGSGTIYVFSDETDTEVRFVYSSID